MVVVKLPQSTIDVNVKYKEAHDALTTMNSIGVLVLAVFAILAAYYLFLFHKTKKRYASIFGYVMYAPQLATSITALLAVGVFLYFWYNRSNMDRLMPLVVLGFFVAFFVIMVVQGSETVDKWETEDASIDVVNIVSNPNENVWSIVFVLSMVSVAVSSIMGFIRMDKFRLYNPSFLAILVSVAILAYFMCNVSSLALQTVSSLDEPWKQTASYFAIMGLALFLCFTFMRLGEKVSEVFLVEQPDLPPTVSEVSVRATDRTRFVLQSLLLLTIVVPSMLVWRVRDKQGPAPENYDTGEQWQNMSLVFFIGFAMIPVLGIVGYELFRVSPLNGNLATSLITAYILFIVAITKVKWSQGTAYTLVTLYIVLIIAFASGGLQSNALGLSLLVSGMFLIVKYLGNIFIDYIDEDVLEEGKQVSDVMRVVSWAGPVFIITSLWIARSYSLGQSYATPAMFLFFSVFYIIVFFYPNREINERQYIPDAGIETNYAIDFFVLFAVIAVTVAITITISRYVNIIGSRLSGGTTPVAQTVLVFVAFVGVSYAAAYMYDYGQTNKQFLEFIRDKQEQLKITYEDFQKDVYKATDWVDLLGTDPCVKDDMCIADMICYEKGNCTDRCYDDDDCKKIQGAAEGAVCDTNDGRCKAVEV